MLAAERGIRTERAARERWLIPVLLASALVAGAGAGASRRADRGGPVTASHPRRPQPSPTPRAGTPPEITGPPPAAGSEPDRVATGGTPRTEGARSVEPAVRPTTAGGPDFEPPAGRSASEGRLDRPAPDPVSSPPPPLPATPPAVPTPGQVAPAAAAAIPDRCAEPTRRAIEADRTGVGDPRRWPELALDVARAIGSGCEIEPCLASRIFFNASRFEACARTPCRMAEAKHWSRAAFAQCDEGWRGETASNEAWWRTLASFAGCAGEVNLRQLCLKAGYKCGGARCNP
jgi:hypothetical protein